MLTFNLFKPIFVVTVCNFLIFQINLINSRYKYLSHQMIDTSGLHHLCQRLSPKALKDFPKPLDQTRAHRAMVRFTFFHSDQQRNCSRFSICESSVKTQQFVI